jgi:regulator of protease activity HflC (stomatin/prohibitin superfamily)
MFSLALDPSMVLLIVTFAIIFVYLVSRFRFIPRDHQCVIERFGHYFTIWNEGLHYLFPFVDCVRKTVDANYNPTRCLSLQEQIVTFSPQGLQTKDQFDVLIVVTATLQIKDPRLYIYGTENPAFSLRKHMTDAARFALKGNGINDALMTFNVQEETETILEQSAKTMGISLKHVTVVIHAPVR